MASQPSHSSEVINFEVVGSRWRSTRNKTGRVWRVGETHRYVPRDSVMLVPEGDAGARGGGVRIIYVPLSRLHDPRYWAPVTR